VPAGGAADVLRERIDKHGAVPLVGVDGRLLGAMLPGHEEDDTLTGQVLLENLACKATAALALRHLLARPGAVAAGDVRYVISCGEEAVGDRYQRGGGNLAKAVAEWAGCTRATGSDVKAFCCGPMHALMLAGALVRSGLHDDVVVLAGGSLAKLGMKFQGHVKHAMPIVEDVLAVRRPRRHDDGVSPCCADAVAPRVASGQAPRHREGASASAGARRTAPDVDRFARAPQPRRPRKAAGSGNVLSNYRTLAASRSSRS
jgi:betaine reductase